MPKDWGSIKSSSSIVGNAEPPVVVAADKATNKVAEITATTVRMNEFHGNLGPAVKVLTECQSELKEESKRKRIEDYAELDLNNTVNAGVNEEAEALNNNSNPYRP